VISSVKPVKGVSSGSAHPVEGGAPAADVTFCPSAQPDMDGAVVFGVIGGTAEEPLVAYLDEPQPATPDLLALAEPVEPTEVFRIGAPCAEHSCRHFAGGECQLGRKLAEDVSPAVQRLPRCRLRPRCRWWHERGADACMRCPMVVTTSYAPGPALRDAADPATSVEAAAAETPPSVSAS
jgi:hypothetical protein